MFTAVISGIAHESVLTDQVVLLNSPKYSPTPINSSLRNIRPSSLSFRRNLDTAGLIVFQESHHCSDQHLCQAPGISIAKRGPKNNWTQRGMGSKDVKDIQKYPKGRMTWIGHNETMHGGRKHHLSSFR